MSVAVDELRVVDTYEGALDKDIRSAARELSPGDIRVLVDHYYALQDLRLQVEGKTRAVVQERDEGSAFVVQTMLVRQRKLEDTVKGALASWVSAESERHPDGPTAWAFSQRGIGPVLATALAAYLPGIERLSDGEPGADRASEETGWERTRMKTKDGEIIEGWKRPRSVPPTVGHWWRFAGLDPTLAWGKGEKRPWNADLKVLCYKIGESFVKVSGQENAFYGQLYAERKAFEVEKDLRGDNAESAAKCLANGKRYAAGQKAVYESGHLPQIQLHRRATRWVAKIFLAHYHEVAYFAEHRKPSPNPYVLDHVPGHAHKIVRPE